ncbi:restriction endonuclease [Microcoleus sp. ZQ-A2]|nr:restriction endonuclease [Microcoleus sp. FACHB-1]
MVEYLDLKKQFKVIIPTDWENDQKGKFFEDLMAELIRKRGWCVKKRLRFTGMEIDILAYDADKPQEDILVECKFSQLNTPLGAGVLTDLVGKATLKDIRRAILVSNSKLGKDAEGLFDEEEKKSKTKSRHVTLNFWDSERLVDMFVDIQRIKLPDLTLKDIGQVKTITLLRTIKEFLWVAEEIGEEGIPTNAIVFPTSEDCILNFEKLEADFSKDNSWRGLKILDGSKIKSTSSNTAQLNSVSRTDAEEIVIPIGIANSFYDHRPCRSKDFIGRLKLQEKFWKFLKNIREGNELTRIVCFSGRTGLGKSSLVVKITEDSRQKEDYKNSFYIYNVDVRSAREENGALFVIGAVKKALQQAIDDNFIELPSYKIFVDSIEQPFSSQSIQKALKNLKINQKTIVIFFDQFENIFTKESLFCVYESFERAAYEVDSIKENIVLGFCWRTGILIPDDHDARKMWDKLSDIRKEFDELKELNLEESRDYLKLFIRYLNKEKRQLSSDTRKWILENCSGLPWAMNKICSAINSDYNQEIIYSYQEANVVIKEMFKKDLQSLTKQEIKCLHYVAENALIKLDILIDKFGEKVIKSLEEKKFLIRSGLNYTIYWDIVRDFILDEEKLPAIPISYRPRYPVDKVLEILKKIIQEKQKGISISELVDIFDFNPSKVKNVVWDLQKFQLVYADGDGKIIAQKNLWKSGEYELANYLAKKLENHIVVRQIYAQLKPNGKMTRWAFEELLEEVYPGKEGVKLKRDTYEDYASRMLPWLYFAGLIEKQQKYLIVRPTGEGKHKGKLLECQSTPPKQTPGQLSFF